MKMVEKDDVLQKVGKLLTKIPEGQEHVVLQQELYYGVEGKLHWVKEGEEPKGSIRLGLPMGLAYIRELGRGLIRKELDELGELFCLGVNKHILIKGVN